MIRNTFLESPRPCHFKYEKKLPNFKLNNLMCYLRKTKTVKISFVKLYAKNLQNFFAKLVHFVALFYRLSKKLKVI